MPTATTQRRLRGRDIAAVLQGRQQRAGRYVVVHVRRGSVDHPARMAVVASRRVGNAVKRNRAKRVLREAARPLPWRDGTDVVLIARAACAAAPMRVVRSEMDRIASTLDVLEHENDVAGSGATAGNTTHAQRELDG